MKTQWIECELCASEEQFKVYELRPKSKGNEEDSLLACETCINQIETPNTIDTNHWRCVNDSMWSVVPAIQAVSWKILNRLKAERWPQDLLDMLYLDQKTLK